MYILLIEYVFFIKVCALCIKEKDIKKTYVTDIIDLGILENHESQFGAKNMVNGVLYYFT